MAGVAIESIDNQGKLHVSNVLDNNTGNYVNYTETSEITTLAQVDGTIYRQWKGSKLIKRDFEREYSAGWFGVKGDNSTDNTTQINKAIDQVFKMGGGIIVFGCGIFKSKYITPKQGVTLRGQGRTGTYFLATDNTVTSFIKRADDGTAVNYFSITDVGIVTALSGVAAAQTTFSNTLGLDLTGSGYFTGTNLTISGFGKGAILFSRAEGGAEGGGFVNTTLDGNYNTLTNINMSACGLFNTEKAAILFGYKANSNKLFGIYTKGNIDTAVVFKYGTDNLISGITCESITNAVEYQAMAFNNTIVQIRCEGISGVMFTARTGSKGNLVLGVHQSTAPTFKLIETGAYLQIIGGGENILRSGPLSTTSLSTTSDINFVDTLGALASNDEPFLWKARGYNNGKYTLQQFLNSKTVTVANDILHAFEFENSDATAGVKGFNAAINVVAVDGSGFTGIDYETGFGGVRTRILRLGKFFEIPGAYNEKHLVMGVNHFWMDAEGYLRTRNTAPTGERQGLALLQRRAGSTANRPVLPADAVGDPYYDTTLGRVVYWTGTAWINSDPDASIANKGLVNKSAAVTGTSPTAVTKTSPAASSVYAQADIQKMVDDITNLTTQLNNLTAQFNLLKANMVTAGQLT